MIIVRLCGGLGNQMFQYAAGHRLAVKLGVPLKLDLSALRHDPRRSYALDAFTIQADIASPEEVYKLVLEPQSYWQRTVARLLGKDPKRANSYVAENRSGFDPAILGLGDNVYLDGYWQSEKYFADIRDLLLKEFQVVSPMGGENALMASEIAKTNSVSVHVRRGDYASDEATRTVHGLCAPSYYRRCAEAILSKCQNPCFYVFSDEPDWVRKHLTLPGRMVVVDHNGPKQGHEDLRLMSQCRHHVIANSSFSWWGAWLGTDYEAMVYAPMRWFVKSDVDTSHLIPGRWIRV